MFKFGKKKDDTPQYLKDIRSKVETLKAGDTAILRVWDGSLPENDLTVIISRGMLDPRKASDLKDVLSGTSTAHRRPSARKGNKLFGMVTK